MLMLDVARVFNIHAYVSYGNTLFYGTFYFVLDINYFLLLLLLLMMMLLLLLLLLLWSLLLLLNAYF